MQRALTLAAIGLGVVAHQPVSACTFQWQKGWSPEEIKQRDDIRRVIGTFEVQDITGSADEDGGLYEGTIYGRLETLRGTGWDTWQDYHRISVDCGANVKPLGYAKGTFWITRKKKDGRYQLLLWEGEYLPAKDAANQDDANETESDAN